jgi:subtilase family serine protease
MRPKKRLRPHVEALETRDLLTAGLPSLLDAELAQRFAHHDHRLADARTSPGAVSYTPGQIRHAYGFDQVSLDGSGQTIAIVDAYDHPGIASNLATFDQAFGLPAPPSFRKVDQTGGTDYPRADDGWAAEIALDVEWAHAIASAANLLLVEANSNSLGDLLTAVNYARSQAGVVAVSMSWGGGEFTSETSYDGYFATPAGHIGGSGLPGGVTFVASSGDSGAWYGPEWPSISSHVLSVGGTSLTLDDQGNYLGETGWSGSGGGYSAYVAEPSYQYSAQTTGSRSNPDVAYDADPYTGFSVYTTVGGSGWETFGGTSAGAPQWAALVAVSNQKRALAGLGSLDGPNQTLPRLYTLPSSHFHDIVSGYNGYYAGPGYDLVTGQGTPYADRIANSLVTVIGTPAVGNFVDERNLRGMFAFARGSDGHLYDTYYYLGQYQWYWQDQGTPAPGVATAGNPAVGNYVDEYNRPGMFAFVLGSDGHLYDTYYYLGQYRWYWQDQGTPPSRSGLGGAASSVVQPDEKEAPQQVQENQAVLLALADSVQMSLFLWPDSLRRDAEDLLFATQAQQFLEPLGPLSTAELDVLASCL